MNHQIRLDNMIRGQTVDLLPLRSERVSSYGNISFDQKILTLEHQINELNQRRIEDGTVISQQTREIEQLQRQLAISKRELEKFQYISGKAPNNDRIYNELEAAISDLRSWDATLTSKDAEIEKWQLLSAQDTQQLTALNEELKRQVLEIEAYSQRVEELEMALQRGGVGMTSSSQNLRTREDIIGSYGSRNVDIGINDSDEVRTLRQQLEDMTADLVTLRKLDQEKQAVMVQQAQREKANQIVLDELHQKLRQREEELEDLRGVGGTNTSISQGFEDKQLARLEKYNNELRIKNSNLESQIRDLENEIATLKVRYHSTERSLTNSPSNVIQSTNREYSEKQIEMSNYIREADMRIRELESALMERDLSKQYVEISRAEGDLDLRTRELLRDYEERSLRDSALMQSMSESEKRLIRRVEELEAEITHLNSLVDIDVKTHIRRDPNIIRSALEEYEEYEGRGNIKQALLESGYDEVEYLRRQLASANVELEDLRAGGHVSKYSQESLLPNDIEILQMRLEHLEATNEHLSNDLEDAHMRWDEYRDENTTLREEIESLRRQLAILDRQGIYSKYEEHINTNLDSTETATANTQSNYKKLALLEDEMESCTRKIYRFIGDANIPSKVKLNEIVDILLKQVKDTKSTNVYGENDKAWGPIVIPAVRRLADLLNVGMDPLFQDKDYPARDLAAVIDSASRKVNLLYSEKASPHSSSSYGHSRLTDTEITKYIDPVKTAAGKAHSMLVKYQQRPDQALIKSAKDQVSHIISHLSTLSGRHDSRRPSHQATTTHKIDTYEAYKIGRNDTNSTLNETKHNEANNNTTTTTSGHKTSASSPTFKGQTKSDGAYKEYLSKWEVNDQIRRRERQERHVRNVERRKVKETVSSLDIRSPTKPEPVVVFSPTTLKAETTSASRIF